MSESTGPTPANAPWSGPPRNVSVATAASQPSPPGTPTILDNVVISAENADPQRFAHEIIAEAVAAARTAHPGLHITGVVERGSPAAVLADRAQDAQLLVLGGHGHSRLFHATLGLTADTVVRSAPCPIVIVPAVRDAVHHPATNDPTEGIPTGIL